MNLEEHLIEKLSEEVHNAWMKEKIEQGFHAPISHHVPIIIEHTLTSVEEIQTLLINNKFTKACEKCHLDLYPYPELPENIKEYDRVTVRAVLGALTKLGWSLRRD